MYLKFEFFKNNLRKYKLLSLNKLCFIMNLLSNYSYLNKSRELRIRIHRFQTLHRITTTE